MLLGYMRVSKDDGTQVLDMQKDALLAAGVSENDIYEDQMSGSKDCRPGLASCVKALRDGDVLVIWRLDRLGRNLKHLIQTVEDLSKRNVGFKVITGAPIDTTSPTGQLVFTIFAALAQFERDTIKERTMAGLAAARARGRLGGRKSVFTASKLRRAQAAMENRDTSVMALCAELEVSRAAIYKYVTPVGELTDKGKALLSKVSK